MPKKFEDARTPREYYEAARLFLGRDEFELMLFLESGPMMMLGGDKAITLNDRTIYLIDPFYGCSPLLLTKEFLSGNAIDVNYIVTVGLDSNIASLFRSLVINPEKLSQTDKILTKDLLFAFNDPRVDYQPIPYYLESAYKNDLDTFLAHAVPTAEAIFRLHSADIDIYLETGEFVSRAGADEHYFQTWNANSYKGVAKAYLEELNFPAFVRQQETILGLISIALKKMLLIEFETTDAKPSEKLERLYQYFSEELNVVMARELMYAAFFFEKRIRNLLRAGRDSKSLFKRIDTAVWDLFMLRLPELIAADGSKKETTLFYPCTADKGAALVGQAIKVFSIFRVKEEFNRMMPMLKYNELMLFSEFGGQRATEILNIVSNQQISRRADGGRERRRKILPEEIKQENDKLISLLSKQLNQ